MNEKECLYCHGKFVPKSKINKFCSEQCGITYSNNQRKGKLINANCLLCGELFSKSETNIKKVYCSPECNNKVKSIRKRQIEATIKNCKICKKPFEAVGRMARAVYCSKECKGEDIARCHVKKNCPNCNETFYADKRQTCCSTKCSNEYTSKLIQKNCESCGTSFKVEPSRENAKYCSQECFYEVRKTGITHNCSCMNCGETFYKAPSLQEKQKYVFCSRECMGEYYKKHKLFAGKNNGNYINFEFERRKKYYGENWLGQRRIARERDGYVCQKCGISEEEYGQELSVHHIKPFILCENYIEANQLENLQSVCEPCHRIIHSGENHPSKFNINAN
jgi:hypothetical protein